MKIKYISRYRLTLENSIVGTVVYIIRAYNRHNEGVHKILLYNIKKKP